MRIRRIAQHQLGQVTENRAEGHPEGEPFNYQTPEGLHWALVPIAHLLAAVWYLMTGK